MPFPVVFEDGKNEICADTLTVFVGSVYQMHSLLSRLISLVLNVKGWVSWPRFARAQGLKLMFGRVLGYALLRDSSGRVGTFVRVGEDSPLHWPVFCPRTLVGRGIEVIYQSC